MIRLQELELVFGHTYVRTDVRTDGWTDRRDVGNSILDFLMKRRLHDLEQSFPIRKVRLNYISRVKWILCLNYVRKLFQSSLFLSFTSQSFFYPDVLRLTLAFVYIDCACVKIYAGVAEGSK